jgi:amino acid permease-like protein
VISNAVPVFKPPEADNARTTLSWMVFLLVAMFAGVLVVAHLDGAGPGHTTVLSQIAHDTVGSGVLYAFVQVSTTLILLIAANSAVNGFPRLLYFMARDGYVPRLFLHMGDRLAFSSGIIVLAIPAALLYVVFNGQTEPLIPLFAIGVFVAFTLAQSAMVAHWWSHREHGWRRALATNLVGAILSGAVVLIAAITKFAAGAWIVVILVPVIVVCCRRIRRYYGNTRQALALQPDAEAHAPREAAAETATGRVSAPDDSTEDDDLETEDCPDEVRHLAVVPIAVLDRASLRALAYAASMEIPTLALHVSPSKEEAKRFQRYWRAWGDHLPLEVLVSPYRSTLPPLANYIEVLHGEHPDITLTVVVPELIPKHRWQVFLQNRVATRLRRMLTRSPGIVITSVPFHLPG